jgi:phage I-like protein
VTEFQVLLDAPGQPVSRIQVAKVGPVSDPRYGDFEISPENARNWARNLAALPGGRALVDFEHRSERKPRDSQAAGWITGVSLDGDRIMADVEWTKEGAKAIRSKRYLFVSPAFGPHENERGEKFEDVLHSCALTNKPQLSDQRPLTLAAPERVELARTATKLLDASDAERDDDWKAQRKAVKDRARQLDVDPRSLGFPKKRKKMSARMLDQAASDRGMVLLSAKKIRRLEQAAADRDDAVRQLDQEAFEREYGEALRERRVVPAQRDLLRKMFDHDRDAVVDLMRSAAPAMPDGPTGEPSIQFDRLELEEAELDFDPQMAARSGVAPDSILLDQRIRSTMRDRGLGMSDYGNVYAELLGDQS